MRTTQSSCIWKKYLLWWQNRNFKYWITEWVNIGVSPKHFFPSVQAYQLTGRSPQATYKHAKFHCDPLHFGPSACESWWPLPKMSNYKNCPTTLLYKGLLRANTQTHIQTAGANIIFLFLWGSNYIVFKIWLFGLIGCSIVRLYYFWFVLCFKTVHFNTSVTFVYSCPEMGDMTSLKHYVITKNGVNYLIFVEGRQFNAIFVASASIYAAILALLSEYRKVDVDELAWS